MKKILVIFVGLLIISSVFAQDENTSSGDSPLMWLGGEVTFGAMSDRDITLGPSFGILLNDNMGVGGTILFSTGNNSNAWGIEPYFRYYLPIVDKFAFFGDAFVGFGGEDNDTNTDGNEHNWFQVGARVGLQFWFTPKWSLAASNNILLFNSRDGNGEFGAGVNFSTVNLSFFYHF